MNISSISLATPVFVSSNSGTLTTHGRSVSKTVSLQSMAKHLNKTSTSSLQKRQKSTTNSGKNSPMLSKLTMAHQKYGSSQQVLKEKALRDISVPLNMQTSHSMPKSTIPNNRSLQMPDVSKQLGLSRQSQSNINTVQEESKDLISLRSENGEDLQLRNGTSSPSTKDQLKQLTQMSQNPAAIMFPSANHQRSLSHHTASDSLAVRMKQKMPTPTMNKPPTNRLNPKSKTKKNVSNSQRRSDKENPRQAMLSQNIFKQSTQFGAQLPLQKNQGTYNKTARQLKQPDLLKTQVTISSYQSPKLQNSSHPFMKQKQTMPRVSSQKSDLQITLMSSNVSLASSKHDSKQPTSTLSQQVSKQGSNKAICPPYNTKCKASAVLETLESSIDCAPENEFSGAKKPLNDWIHQKTSQYTFEVRKSPKICPQPDDGPDLNHEYFNKRSALLGKSQGDQTENNLLHKHEFLMLPNRQGSSDVSTSLMSHSLTNNLAREGTVQWSGHRTNENIQIIKNPSGGRSSDNSNQSASPSIAQTIMSAFGSVFGSNKQENQRNEKQPFRMVSGNGSHNYNVSTQQSHHRQSLPFIKKVNTNTITQIREDKNEALSNQEPIQKPNTIVENPFIKYVQQNLFKGAESAPTKQPQKPIVEQARNQKKAAQLQSNYVKNQLRGRSADAYQLYPCKSQEKILQDRSNTAQSNKQRPDNALNNYMPILTDSHIATKPRLNRSSHVLSEDQNKPIVTMRSDDQYSARNVSNYKYLTQYIQTQYDQRGRNDVFSRINQIQLTGFSSLSKSPVRDRKFTAKPHQPIEDQAVESMNIATIDMVYPTPPREPLQNPLLPKNTSGIFEQAQDFSGFQADASQGKLRGVMSSESISQTVRATIGDPKDKLQRNQNSDIEVIQCVTETEQGAFPGLTSEPQPIPPVIQQQTQQRSLSSMCSCSGCMASQTIYQPTPQDAQERVFPSPGQPQPVFIDLEPTLNECKYVRNAINLLSFSKGRENLTQETKESILEEIQQNCQLWWEQDSQFYILSGHYEQEESEQGTKLSFLIKRSQVLLSATIGIIAADTIQMLKGPLDGTHLSEFFEFLNQSMHQAYSIQMKLTSLILKKIAPSERHQNEFARLLIKKINQFKIDLPNQQVFRGSEANEEEEESLDGQNRNEENDSDVLSIIYMLLEHQRNLIKQHCDYGQDNSHGNKSHHEIHRLNQDIYGKLLSICESQATDLEQSKVLITNVVYSIQDSTILSATEIQKNLSSNSVERPQQQANMDLSSEQPLNLAEINNQEDVKLNMSLNQSAHILEKQQKLKDGSLSAINEEPNCNMSTTKDFGVSMEHGDSSRLSNLEHSSAFAGKDVTVCINSFKQPDSSLGENDFENLLYKPKESLELPPSTKDYTLFLDLDETLIHSQLQFKKPMKTNQEQQEYLDDIRRQFKEEHKRTPTKDEVDQIALEYVFNIRPYTFEFLKEMAVFFELVIFTAGEQDYADEVLDALDTDKQITHRLYRQHTVQVKDHTSGLVRSYIKDISLTGRDMRKSIIIDNLRENFCRQESNGIQIVTWRDDPFDTELQYLKNLLIKIVTASPKDIRKELDLRKEYGLLPKHSDQNNSCDDYSSETNNRRQSQADQNGSTISLEENKDQMTSAGGQGDQNLNHSQHSVAEQNSHDDHSSIVQKSISNSSYQKRRLSEHRFEEVVVGDYSDFVDNSGLRNLTDTSKTGKEKPLRSSLSKKVDEEEVKIWQNCIKAMKEVINEDFEGGKAGLQRPFDVSVEDLDKTTTKQSKSGLARKDEIGSGLRASVYQQSLYGMDSQARAANGEEAKATMGREQ